MARQSYEEYLLENVDVIIEMREKFATYQEIANHLNVSLSVLKKYKVSNPIIRAALETNRKLEAVTAEIKVRDELFNTKYDFEYYEDLKIDPETGEPAIDENGEYIFIPVSRKKKTYHPPQQLLMFYLKNKDPERWKDMQNNNVSINDDKKMDAIYDYLDNISKIEDEKDADN